MQIKSLGQEQSLCGLISSLLTSEKLTAATALVQEQLAVGHIEPTTSWNTPIFVIVIDLKDWFFTQKIANILH